MAGGSHSLEEVRAGYVEQVQANILELAGNFLLQTREADSECAGSPNAEAGTQRGGVRAGQASSSLPQGWAALTHSPKSGRGP